MGPGEERGWLSCGRGSGCIDGGWEGRLVSPPGRADAARKGSHRERRSAFLRREVEEGRTPFAREA